MHEASLSTVLYPNLRKNFTIHDRPNFDSFSTDNHIFVCMIGYQEQILAFSNF